MKRHLAIYAGTIAFLLATGGPVLSEPTGSSTMGSGSTTPTQPVTPDKTTDLTGGKAGIPEEYSDTPVRQGKLIEVSDSKYLNSPVYGSKGEELGKIQKVLKDKETGDIEYVMFVTSWSQRAMPIRWSQFQTKGDKLQIKLKKEDLQNDVTMNSDKDMSPDIKEYMGALNQARSAPTTSGNPGIPGQKNPNAAGSMGEDSVGGGGPSGTSALPPGQAPQLEGGNPSSKR
jgi:hypothetical protein